MEKKNTILIGLIILSIAIVIGSSRLSKALIISSENISNSIYGGTNNVSNSLTNTSTYEDSLNEKNNLNFIEAIDYLGISESELNLLIEKEEFNLPFVKINGTYIFNKEGLDKWIQESKVRY